MLSKTLTLAVLLAATVVSATLTSTSSNTIVDLAVATPDLSTLVTALKAADLVDTLSGKGPFTVFAPTNEAFAKLPAGALANLLKPENKAQLVDILTYHVAAGDVHAKDLYDKEMIPTVEGKNVTARVSSDGIFINSAKVTAADNDASNGVVHIIDAVLMPPSAPPSPGHHLWFRGFTKIRVNFTKDYPYQCAEVDAAPRMPDAIFDPSNAATLKAYEDITIALFGAFGGLEKVNLELGRCEGKNYTRPNLYPTKVDWAPKQLMRGICAAKCKCNFPECPDAPDDPSAGTWCSLCGPKFNAPITVQAYQCGLAPGQCKGPDPKTLVADSAQVVEDLLLERL